MKTKPSPNVSPARRRASLRSRARELLNGRSLVFSTPDSQIAEFNPSVFRRGVDLALEFGATHLGVGWIPFRHTWFLPDNHDPYAAWSNTSLGLFRAFPPRALRRWIPQGEARRIQAVFASRQKLLRAHGLKGVVEGCEPLWLPEGVYRAHPRWRGPQCELGRIARRAYFAPSIDEPEVLDLYREAMCEVAGRFPEIDQFSFLCNDSGSGISWSPCMYPGMNGPARWRTRDPGERIAGWLKAMQEGAARAGVRVRLNCTSSGQPPAVLAATRARLGEGLFMGGANAQGQPWMIAGATLGGGLWSPFYPAVGLGSPVDFVEGLQRIYSNPDGDTGRATLCVEETSFPLARTLLECFLDEPGTGLLHRDTVLLKAAERLGGSARTAEVIVQSWSELRTVEAVVTKVQQKGFSTPLPWGCVSMRWLTRPLVPDPARLTPKETAHFRKFLFSKDTEEENANLCRVLGKPVFVGSCVTWMARWALADVIGRLQRMRAAVREEARQARSRGSVAWLETYAARLGAYACLAETARNVIMYQHALDTADQPQFGPNMMDYDDNITYDQRALVLRKIAREEVDNIAELLEILDSQSAPVLHHARNMGQESVFLLGPRLKSDLRRKLAIMMDHWHDHEQRFPTTKTWDFEPAPKGNIPSPRAAAFDRLPEDGD